MSIFSFRGSDIGWQTKSLRQHDGERQDVFSHHAIADRIGARGARRSHAAEGSVRPRINRKEKALIAQMLVELLMGDTSIHRNVEIIGVDLQNPVHLRNVDAHPAAECSDVALKSSTAAVNHCSLATKPVWHWSKVNRSIHFPVLVFLVLVGLLLLLTGSAIFSRASQPKARSAKAINDAPVETAGLVRQDFVGTFPEPVKDKISVNYQEGYSFIGARLNKVAARLSGVPSHPKNHVHPRGSRLRANLWTRIHARTLGFFERGWRMSQKPARKPVASRALGRPKNADRGGTRLTLR